MIREGMFIADRYEVLAKIGAGGMSDVYKAKDHVLGRFVAIKVLKTEFSEDTGFVSKFRTEAQSAAGLEHPNIVNIYDVGSEEGMYYIVMEYIEGVTLKTYIEKKGQLSYKEAISIAIQVGRGIEAAHNKNIIHRDIKPQNIMISTDGKVKVTDFGIARAASSNTIHSDVMGSVHYSSPEQARNGYVDNKSDLYSLGIVMYEMVTGRVPFDGDTAVAVAIQHLQEDMTSPSTYAPELPISLEKIILKCTQKSPDRRYQTMADLLVDLKRALIHPDEDFVTMVDVNNQERTRVMGEEEVSQIKEQTDQDLIDELTEDEYDEDEDDEEDGGILNPKLEKAVTIMGIVAAVVIVIIIIWLIASFFGLFSGSSSSTTTETETETETETDSDTVEMIDVTGMTYDEAKEALNEIGLGIFEQGEESSDLYDEGEIISSDPEEGEEVSLNTTVKVTVSSGAGTISVPDVTGKSYEDAEEILEDAGFKVSKTTESSNSVEEGYVISTSPSSSSTAKKGETITVTVSSGPSTFTMPNYEGQDQSTVVNELQNTYGCTVTVTTEYSSTYASGKVVGQSVSAGTTVNYGSSVTIAVSKGQQTYSFSTTVTVPTTSSGTITSATYYITDTSGNILVSSRQAALDTSGSYFLINHTGLTGSSSGYLYITWNFADGTSSNNATYPIAVTFTAEN